MPMVNIQVTREAPRRPERRHRRREGPADRRRQPAAAGGAGQALWTSTLVVVQEVELENWGWGGLPVPEYCKALAMPRAARPDLAGRPPGSALPQRRSTWSRSIALRTCWASSCLPVIRGPMAGATDAGGSRSSRSSNAGGLGSLPSALYSEVELRAALETVRARDLPADQRQLLQPRRPRPGTGRQAAWRRAPAPTHVEAGLDPDAPVAAGGQAPFDAAFAGVVEDLRPEVVSFHFGLPAPELIERAQAHRGQGAVLGDHRGRGRWLEARGVDAVIAMGVEAGRPPPAAS
ncbi:nitronate monooxygenase [Caulobacter segnis]